MSEMTDTTESRTAKLYSTFNPLEMTPAFVTPIFRHKNMNLVQVINRNNNVEGFENIENEIKPPKSSNLIKVDIQIGQPAIYSFAFSKIDILFGTKEDLAKVLLERIDELNNFPYVLKDVIEFIEDVLPDINNLKEKRKEALTEVVNSLAKYNSSIATEWLNVEIISSLSKNKNGSVFESVEFIRDILPDIQNLKINHEKAITQIFKSLSKYNLPVALEWQNIQILTSILQHADQEGYINYLDLISELENVVTTKGRVLIRVKLVRSLIGLSPKMRDILKYFGFASGKINSESSLIQLDKYAINNLKHAITRILVIEIRVPSEIAMTIKICDALATQKRYLKKNVAKNVKGRDARDYICEISVKESID